MNQTRIRRKRKKEAKHDDRSVLRAPEAQMPAPLALGRGFDIRTEGAAHSGDDLARMGEMVQRDGAQSAMLRALFEGGVVSHIGAAHTMLASAKPNLKGASAELNTTVSTLGPMIPVARAGNNEVQALQISDLANVLREHHALVEEHAGHPTPISQIATEIDPAAGFVQGRVKQIQSGFDNPATPSEALNPGSAIFQGNILFQGAVGHIMTAHTMLSSAKPNLKGASAELNTAIGTLGPLTGTARAANNEIQALQIADLANVLVGHRAIIEEHAGHPTPISQIAAAIDPAGTFVQTRVRQIQASFDSPAPPAAP